MASLLHLRRLVFLVLLFVAPVVRAEKWTTLNDCELDKNAYADGDSFHIHSGSREMIIRLYFVDCPETDDRFPARVKTQADYFGITTPEVLKLGEKAAEFTRQTLSQRFTVVTQREDARGNSNEPRYYGFVLLEDGKKNFAEMLVANGLARVFGAPASRPDGPDANAQWQQLRRLEATAKTQRLGGWGGRTANGSIISSSAPLSTTAANEDFFRKAKAIQTPTPTPVILTPRPTAAPRTPASTPAPESDAGAIDLNSATLEELENLPKIGPVLAARIMEARPFATVEELRNVKGIKDEIFERISPLVKVKVK